MFKPFSKNIENFLTGTVTGTVTGTAWGPYGDRTGTVY